MNKDKRNEGETPIAAVNSAAALGGEGASVDKIRDILFGVQMRDYDKKFARLEENLMKETSDLKEEVKRSLAAFDSFVKQELESLAERLKGEQNQRLAAVKDVKQALEERTTQLDEALDRGMRETRQHLLDQHRNLSEEIRKKSEDAAASLKKESGELRSDKADRAALAALFAEVSLRLKDEFKIPGTANG